MLINFWNICRPLRPYSSPYVYYFWVSGLCCDIHATIAIITITSKEEQLILRGEKSKQNLRRMSAYCFDNKLKWSIINLFSINSTKNHKTGDFYFWELFVRYSSVLSLDINTEYLIKNDNFFLTFFPPPTVIPPPTAIRFWILCRPLLLFHPLPLFKSL